MEKDEIAKKVEEVILATCFQNCIDEDDVEYIKDSYSLEASLEDDLELDSMDGADIVFTLGQHFNITIPPEEAEAVKTVNDVIECIYRNYHQ